METRERDGEEGQKMEKLKEGEIRRTLKKNKKAVGISMEA